MYVAIVPNRTTRPAILLRESYRSCAAVLQPEPTGLAGQAVHGFRTKLADLAMLTCNTIKCGNAVDMTVLARPTKSEQRALNLLGVRLVSPGQSSAHADKQKVDTRGSR
jgi:hypothetical protein